MTDSPLVNLLRTAVDSLGPQLSAVASLGLAIGVAIFGLRKGWQLVKYFMGWGEWDESNYSRKADS